MDTKLSSTSPDHAGSSPDAADTLRAELHNHQSLFEEQPSLIQRFLDTQAGSIADAYVQNDGRINFVLPNQIVIEPGQPARPIPSAFQTGHPPAFGIGQGEGRASIRRQLEGLESNSDPAVSAAGSLLRYATAAYMIYNMLPSGRTVVYRTLAGDQIPSVPVRSSEETPSAMTAATDAIVEEDEPAGDDLVVPYVPAARRFYMPQWVAFDDEGHLLVNSSQEAEAYIGSMKRFVGILHGAVAIAPYFVADEAYQRKRYGILGQLVNQGRALALHQTGEIIQTIKAKAAAGALNRGLSLSLPYFDDQALEIRLHDFQVIPPGRVMFVPAFVTRAASLEQAKVLQDTRISPSTRKYLLDELQMLADAFLGSAN